MKLPPPPKWNTATDDIDTTEWASNLFRRVQDRERSLLPSGIIFPHTGQIWEAVRDCEVYFIASFRRGSAFEELRWVPGQRRPDSPTPPACGRARLSRGEKVRVLSTDDPKPLVVWFHPLRYHKLQESIVPAEVRNARGYSHYRLTLRTAHLACCLQHETEYFTEAF